MDLMFRDEIMAPEISGTTTTTTTTTTKKVKEMERDLADDGRSSLQSRLERVFIFASLSLRRARRDLY